MIIIGEKLISDDVVSEQFACHLDACKGACCWEGDFGAPLEKEEVAILKEIEEKVRPFLTKKGLQALDEQGAAVYDRRYGGWTTPLINGGPCAYMTKNPEGIAFCGIEQAHRSGAVDFLKPISCHLYPIRVEKSEGFEALNYDRWDICSAACNLGKKEGIKVYQFVKNAIIRKYGQDFYDELDAAAEYMENGREE